jgi:phenolic acid decarboxylase
MKWRLVSETDFVFDENDRQSYVVTNGKRFQGAVFHPAWLGTDCGSVVFMDNDHHGLMCDVNDMTHWTTLEEFNEHLLATIGELEND